MEGADLGVREPELYASATPRGGGGTGLVELVAFRKTK